MKKTLSKNSFESILILEEKRKNRVSYQAPLFSFQRKDNKLNSRPLDFTNDIYNFLKQFKIYGEIGDIKRGPLVDSYLFYPVLGTKLKKILNIENELSLYLRVKSLRILISENLGSVNIEIPRNDSSYIYFSNLIQNPLPPMRILLGVNTHNEVQSDLLMNMPHLLIAGRTGSGKSVLLHSIILSLITYNHPDDCHLIMIDTKILDLSLYKDIPHLLYNVVTDKSEVKSLLWCLNMEMDRRYSIMSQSGCLKIENFNLIHQNKLPYIILIIDEISDLMLSFKKEIEPLMQRLAQMARAAGIHLIFSTQRPSTDIITGSIKANFPARIAFQLKTKTDSRVVLDSSGAERLLDKGDMLYAAANGALTRIHSPFITENEIKSVAQFICAQKIYPKRFIEKKAYE